LRIRLGIIGPEDSVDKICKVAKEYEDRIEVYSYIYELKEETISRVVECQRQVDVLLFSGHIPYYIAKRAGVIEKPNFYIPRVGISILKAMYEMDHLGIDYSKMSIDSIQEEALLEVAEEVGITFDKYYLVPYKENIDYEVLEKKHCDLWEEGKTNIAITGLSKTYDDLLAKNIPVFKITPTTFLIREYITKAIYAVDVKKIRATQVAVQIVKLKGIGNYHASEYAFLNIKNTFEKGIIDYTKEILGSYFPFGRDEYMIFSTRGVISSTVENSHFINNMSNGNHKNIVFASGVGYGNTVYDAEKNARIALNHAMEIDKSAIFIVEEQGQITGPITNDKKEAISYAIRVDDKEVLRISDEIKLSPAYISKIQSIVERTSSDAFDAKSIATLLEVSIRSARRILGVIVEGGYAEIIAKESVSKTGRPRQIYRINFNKRESNML